jgi:hypothetical protein
MKLILRILSLLVIALGVAARAQTPAVRPAPHIGYLYPAGGQQGTTVTVAVGGQLLTGATQIYFSGRGLQARVLEYDRPLTNKELMDLREKATALQEKRAAARNDPKKPGLTPAEEKTLTDIRAKMANRNPRPTNPALAETVTLAITIAPDCPTGERELRLKTSNGLSNPFTFCVGSLVESVEPVVTATTGAAKKQASRGETRVALPAVINGQILPGEVDRYRFTARKGQRLTIAAAARSLNPYLADAVPGWFQATLALFDDQGHEVAYNDDFRFQPDPVLLCEVPRDGDYVVEIKDAIFRGREDFVYRIGLGELPFVTGIFPLGGQAGGQVKFEAMGWNLPLKELTVDALDKPRGTYELTLRNASGTSNKVPFAVDDQATTLEAEPNDRPASAQAFAVPAVLEGRIGVAGDQDVYVFEGVAGTSLVAEVLARRLGSPLDSILEVTDATGRRVAMNDDFDDRGAGLLTHQSDSRVEFTVPFGGKYYVRVADTERRGGTDFTYRLRVGPPRPDFALRITPSSINVRGGTSVPVTVYALRRDGYAGEITLALRDAPPGCVLSGARIPANEDRVQLTLTALTAPRDDPYELRILGVADIGGKRVAHMAVPADDLMQAFAYHHLVVAQDGKLQVAGKGALLRPLTRGPVRIPLGGTARVRIAAPGARLTDLKFEFADPVEGLSVKECVAGRDFVEVVIACDAAKIKQRREGNLVLHTIAERTIKGKAAANRVQRNAVGVVPAIPFEVIDSTVAARN